jgi:hypothetical protein
VPLSERNGLNHDPVNECYGDVSTVTLLQVGRTIRMQPRLFPGSAGPTRDIRIRSGVETVPWHPTLEVSCESHGNAPRRSYSVAREKTAEIDQV